MSSLEEPTTATGDDDGARPGESPVTTLRWVHPAPGNVTVLSAAPVIIGRDTASTVHLDSSQVSRRHAEVRSVAGVYGIEDQGSKNGIFVNGERCQSAKLRAGDVVRVGHAVAVVEVGSPGDLVGFEALGHGIFGGAAMHRAVRRAKKAAAGTLNVVLQGETGTGKERVAQAIHAWSQRPGRFLAVNGASYTEGAMGAELLGHVRSAEHGTLLLDEIVDLPVELQSQLLRVIEQREVLPPGEGAPVRVDVRFIAACQLPLAEAATKGRFRADLRARLEGIVIELVPLRARRADIVPLFRELVALHGKRERPELDTRAAETLCLHDFPMNVRELENVARRLLSLHGENTEIGLDQVLDALAPDAGGAAAGDDRARRRSVSSYSAGEIEALIAAIERHQGNLTKAADELGLNRSKAYRMLRASKARR